jgi:hypothetical protein
MAKRQQQFDGDGFPARLPKAVQEARDEYLTAMRSAAKAVEKRGNKELALMEAMKKHKVDRVRLDGENKFFEIDNKEKIACRTIPKEQRKEAEEA